MASLYTHPYYIAHYERYGLRKEADWIEYQITPPAEAPERMRRVARLVEQRCGLHLVKVKNSRDLRKRYGYSYFDVLDAAYQKLYNYQPMTERQKQYYCKMYFPLLNFDFVTMVANENDEIVAVGLGMPSLSDALRKCRGRLFPFGFMHVLKSLKVNDTLDLFLIAVRPDCQNSGINAIMLNHVLKGCHKMGITKAETGPQLELNDKIQNQWSQFNYTNHKRRRCWIKKI
jgi:GNAT superfamily N-acetyltransferase